MSEPIGATVFCEVGKVLKIRFRNDAIIIYYLRGNVMGSGTFWIGSCDGREWWVVGGGCGDEECGAGKGEVIYISRARSRRRGGVCRCAASIGSRAGPIASRR